MLLTANKHESAINHAHSVRRIIPPDLIGDARPAEKAHAAVINYLPGQTVGNIIDERYRFIAALLYLLALEFYAALQVNAPFGKLSDLIRRSGAAPGVRLRRTHQRTAAEAFKLLLPHSEFTVEVVYERCGFVRSHNVPNFFTDNYDHPIYEGGVQLIDMVYLQRHI